MSTSIKQYGTSVQVPKASELISAAIKKQIVMGEIKDGEALPPETELMAQFQVSRPTLREALRILESEDLISVRRGSRGGAVAHQMTSDLVSRHAGILLQSRGTTLADVYEAISIFEPACVRMVALNHTEEDLELLRETVRAEKQSIEDGTKLAIEAGFHYNLVKIYGNQTLLLFAELLRDITVAAAAAEYHIGVDQEQAVHDHKEVLDLIEARDGRGAHELWATHLRQIEDRVLGRLGGGIKVVDLLS